jgi:hypothetical protein
VRVALTTLAAVALAACQPPDDEQPAALGPLIIEGPGQDAVLEVRPADGASFQVILGAATRVQVQHTSGSPPRAEVLGPHLAFTADATDLDYQTNDELWLWQGLVRVERGLWVHDVRWRDGRLVGSAQPERDLLVEGLTWPAQGLRPTRPELGEGWWSGGSDPLPSEDAPLRANAAGESLTLHASPGDARKLRFLPDWPEHTYFDVLQTAGDWTEVRWKGGLMQVRGWAATASLRFVEGIGGVMYSGGIGCSAGRPDMHTLTGRARVVLPPGTLIHAQPARGPWARVHTALTAEVAYDGSGWGRIMTLPDLDGPWSLGHAWVDLGRLTAAAP